MYVDEIVERVSYGERLTVNLKERSIKLGKKKITEPIECSYDTDNLLETLALIEKYYCEYEKSMPSERSENKRKYFYAKPMNDLEDADIMFSANREVAQAWLELTVLALIESGKLYWDNEIMHGKWFWQCPTNKNLILLKEWIV